MAIGSHQSAKALKTVWLTPPAIITALGGAESFDLDPCSLDPRPFPTAKHHLYLPTDGLAADWYGRVWLNPPYTSDEIGDWLRKLADHGTGTALIFARTETEAFVRQVWRRADSLLFLYGRLNFYHANGVMAKGGSGAPSVLCAYGDLDTERLATSGIKGHFIPLRLSRGIVVMMWSGLPSWSNAVQEWVRSQGGTVSVKLKGILKEIAPNKTRFVHRFLQIRVRSAEFTHRLELVTPVAWTLFITGPKIREWGFHCPKGWIHWRDFTSGPNGEAVGKGCGE